MNNADDPKAEESKNSTGYTWDHSLKWRPVDPAIWDVKANQHKGTIFRLTSLIRGALLSIPIPILILPMVLFLPLSLLMAYRLGGEMLVGPIFFGTWAVIIGLAVLFIEKKGYARNFEGWDISIRSIIILPIAFLVAAGLIYALFLIRGVFH